MEYNSFSKKYLRGLAIVVIAIIFAVLIWLAFFITIRLHDTQDVQAENGYLRLDEVSIDETPVYLHGEWEYFDGAIANNAQELETLSPEAPVMLPLGTITQAQKDATYRLRFTMPKVENNQALFIFLPTYECDVNLFLNGQKLDKVQNDVNWVSDTMLGTQFALPTLENTNELQELIISGDFSNRDFTLYKQPIVMSTISGISMLSSFDSSNQMVLAGMLLLVLINGFVFMMFRPEHKIITTMTLFDICIMIHAFTYMNYLSAFIRGIMPRILLSDRLVLGISIFSLQLGGIMGCLLAVEIFDPKRKIPQWLIKPLPYLYAVYAIVFSIFPTFYEAIGIKILIFTYVITFVGVGLQFFSCMKNTHKPAYYIMQGLKTAFIGVVILVDLIFWNVYIDLSLLLYLYGIFFIFHVIVRLYDNNEAYHESETLNRNLEATVTARTLELQKANNELSELTIRDPLTKAYNRLHFEREIEKTYAHCVNTHENLHLCIMDLDFFKAINDTYGHDAGDDQLRMLYPLVDEIIGNKAMFARIGGEEFVLMFVNQEDSIVLDLIEQVRVAIENESIKNKKRTTASFGVARLEEGDKVRDLLKNADMALYATKDAGRNRVDFYNHHHVYNY